MEIVPQQIQKKEVIGLYKGEPVVLLVTFGGYNIVGSSKDGKFEVMGVGPNDAMAKFIAQKKYPDIQLKIEKSEPEFFCIPTLEVKI